MSLIKSISGIRGTIGGKPGDNLTPIDAVKFTTAYSIWLKEKKQKNAYTVVVGRDARISGQMIKSLVVSTLNAMAIDVIDIDFATTPTTEIAVTHFGADGGIIITASHNPKQWNALKLLNSDGEFLSAADGQFILDVVNNIDEKVEYADVFSIGKTLQNNALNAHIDKILSYKYVDKTAIEQANLTVAIDCINSVSAVSVPELLYKLGVKNIVKLNCTPDGNFAHTPEPVPENLTDLQKAVVENNCQVGFALDPDVDRLAIVDEKGNFFGEEYTVVACADYILQHEKGNLVSNLSSSKALKDLALQYGVEYHPAAVGEVNVVEKMKQVDAIIGGEGNGGVILPALHYGRDALIGIALILTYMAKSKLTVSQIRQKYTDYKMIKTKYNLTSDIDLDQTLDKIKIHFAKQNPVIYEIDGLKIEFSDKWFHIRKSNTEPIVRIIAEAKTESEVENLINEVKSFL